MLKPLLNSILDLFEHFCIKNRKQLNTIIWQASWSSYLTETVSFYRVLNAEEQLLFEQGILLFWQTTHIEGGVEVIISDEDRLLVGASAIIPVWAFKGWHYLNLRAVYLLPDMFNAKFECGQPDSLLPEW